MLTLEKDQLIVRFPEVHADAHCKIEFQRTLRIPDDNRVHSLPPGLGRFPLSHVDDYADKLPQSWSEHGGVLLPIHQGEAMWIRFHSTYPFAVKIAAGKVNAVSGEPWAPELKTSLKQMQAAHDLRLHSPEEQALFLASPRIPELNMKVSSPDYVTIPKQPWLDGFNVGAGKIRQFVAMPMGDGYTVEEQITGEALHGGLQIIVYPLKPEFYRPPAPRVLRSSMSMSFAASSAGGASAKSAEMGMAPGGLMTQNVYADSYGIEKWDQTHSARCFVHLLNSQQYRKVTGKNPPTVPPTARDYTNAGLPWFEYYAEPAEVIDGGEKLKKLDSVAALGVKKSETPLSENDAVLNPTIVPIKTNPNQVKEGNF